MGPDRNGGCVAAVEQSKVLVCGTIVGKKSGVEGRVVEFRRACVVIKIRTGENKALLSLIELQNSVGD